MNLFKFVTFCICILCNQCSTIPVKQGCFMFNELLNFLEYYNNFDSRENEDLDTRYDQLIEKHYYLNTFEFFSWIMHRSIFVDFNDFYDKIHDSYNCQIKEGFIQLLHVYQIFAYYPNSNANHEDPKSDSLKDKAYARRRDYINSLNSNIHYALDLFDTIARGKNSIEIIAGLNLNDRNTVVAISNILQPFSSQNRLHGELTNSNILDAFRRIYYMNITNDNLREMCYYISRIQSNVDKAKSMIDDYNNLITDSEKSKFASEIVNFMHGIFQSKTDGINEIDCFGIDEKIEFSEDTFSFVKEMINLRTDKLISQQESILFYPFMNSVKCSKCFENYLHDLQEKYYNNLDSDNLEVYLPLSVFHYLVDKMIDDNVITLIGYASFSEIESEFSRIQDRIRDYRYNKKSVEVLNHFLEQYNSYGMQNYLHETSEFYKNFKKALKPVLEVIRKLSQCKTFDLKANDIKSQGVIMAILQSIYYDGEVDENLLKALIEDIQKLSDDDRDEIFGSPIEEAIEFLIHTKIGKNNCNEVEINEENNVPTSYDSVRQLILMIGSNSEEKEYISSFEFDKIQSDTFIMLIHYSQTIIEHSPKTYTDYVNLLNQRNLICNKSMSDIRALIKFYRILEAIYNLKTNTYEDLFQIVHDKDTDSRTKASEALRIIYGYKSILLNTDWYSCTNQIFDFITNYVENNAEYFNEKIISKFRSTMDYREITCEEMFLKILNNLYSANKYWEASNDIVDGIASEFDYRSKEEHMKTLLETFFEKIKPLLYTKDQNNINNATPRDYLDILCSNGKFFPSKQKSIGFKQKTHDGSHYIIKYEEKARDVEMEQKPIIYDDIKNIVGDIINIKNVNKEEILDILDQYIHRGESVPEVDGMRDLISTIYISRTKQDAIKNVALWVVFDSETNPSQDNVDVDKKVKEFKQSDSFKEFERIIDIVLLYDTEMAYTLFNKPNLGIFKDIFTEAIIKDAEYRHYRKLYGYLCISGIIILIFCIVVILACLIGFIFSYFKKSSLSATDREGNYDKRESESANIKIEDDAELFMNTD